MTDSDLAPVLDIEWDMTKSLSGAMVDRWAEVSRDDLVKEALAWLIAVERATGRKPVIYTAASWWEPRMGTDKRLAGYVHWLADYRQSSMNAGAPKQVVGHPYVAWQFTDTGKIAALARVDVNRLKSVDLTRLRGMLAARP